MKSYIVLETDNNDVNWQTVEYRFGDENSAKSFLKQKIVSFYTFNNENYTLQEAANDMGIYLSDIECEIETALKDGKWNSDNDYYLEIKITE